MLLFHSWPEQIWEQASKIVALHRANAGNSMRETAKLRESKKVDGIFDMSLRLYELYLHTAGISFNDVITAADYNGLPQKFRDSKACINNVTLMDYPRPWFEFLKIKTSSKILPYCAHLISADQATTHQCFKYYLARETF